MWFVYILALLCRLITCITIIVLGLLHLLPAVSA
jgi:hypothetical protein